jgi:cell division protein FtsQ
MDDRGRLAQSLTRTAPKTWSTRLARCDRRLSPILDVRLPRGTGAAAVIALLLATAGYGVVQGGHLQVVAAQLADARDALANAAGFRIATIAIGGEKEVSREQVLAIAGVTGRSSLLFLDADAARTRLKQNPWIADATILKLYPHRLHIDIVERKAFALWQKDGRVAVIAADGVVVEPYVAPRYLDLPLVVGEGAEKRAADFLKLLDTYPQVRDQMRAAILVAQRRWNLKLKNGIDVRLPEFEPARAIETLIALDRDKQILSRDILAIDLRLPDRVTVRLSEAAGEARDQAFKDKKTRRKGGDA